MRRTTDLQVLTFLFLVASLSCFAPQCLAQIITYVPELSAPPNDIFIGQTFLVTGERGGACFTPTLYTPSSGGLTIFQVHVDVHDSSIQSTGNDTNSGNTVAGFANDTFGVSVSDSYTDRYVTSVDKDDQKITVYMNVYSNTGHDGASSLQLNQLGTQSAALGAAGFFEKCGLLVATDEYRTLEIRFQIDLTFNSLEKKQDIGNSMKTSLGGSYDGFGASATFTGDFDRALDSISSQFTFDVNGSFFSSSGVKGLGQMLTDTNTQIEKTSIFSDAVKAATAAISSKENDPGAASQVVFSNTDRYAMPDLQLVDWDTRRQFLLWAQRANDDISKLETILAGRFPYQDIREGGPNLNASRTFEQNAWYRVCGTRVRDSANTPWYSEEKDEDLGPIVCHFDPPNDPVEGWYADAHKELSLAVNACMAAKDNTDQSAFCSDNAKVIALSPLLYELLDPNANRLHAFLSVQEKQWLDRKRNNGLTNICTLRQQPTVKLDTPKRWRACKAVLFPV